MGDNFAPNDGLSKGCEVLCSRSNIVDGAHEPNAVVDRGYPRNHRPLWISNFTEPSSRIFNKSDWQDSSFMTLARLMISYAVFCLKKKKTRIFSRSRITRYP